MNEFYIPLLGILMETKNIKQKEKKETESWHSD